MEASPHNVVGHKVGRVFELLVGLPEEKIESRMLNIRDDSGDDKAKEFNRITSHCYHPQPRARHAAPINIVDGYSSRSFPIDIIRQEFIISVSRDGM